MSGDRLAYLSLRFDAIYCILLGVAVAVAAPLTTGAVALPSLLLLGIGVATSLWGVCVWLAASRRPIRTSARLVMFANVVASAGLILTGLVAGTTVLALAAFALAVEVAAFAASQGIALRRMRSAAV